MEDELLALNAAKDLGILKLNDYTAVVNRAYSCGGPENSPTCLYDFTALNLIPETFTFSVV
jgi:hypothetical protein